jgi:spoIIIJ-associated protein
VHPNDRENPVTDQTTSETDVPETDAAPTDADQTEAPEAAAEASSEVTATDSDTATDADSESDSGDSDEDGESEGSGEGDLDRLENEGDIAADYLEEFLDIADLDGDLDMDVEGDRAAVSIVGGDVRQLVGRNGEVLEALQELTRLAVYRETGERSRLMLDVGGYRADKRTRLEKLAAEAVAEVKESGERKALDAMTPFERKVVHDAVAAAGLGSESEGEEPKRYVVVLPSR